MPDTEPEAAAATPTPPPRRAPPGTTWFVDTSSLMTMAIDPDIAKVVKGALAGASVVLLDVVVDELEHRASVDGPNSLAAIALPDLGWMTLMNSGRYVDVSDVEDVQWTIAGGCEPTDPYQHWAESVTIVMTRTAHAKGSTTRTMFLSEDADARIEAAEDPLTKPMSSHRLFWELVRAGKLEAAEAVRLAGLIESEGRGPSCELADFTARNPSRIGRVGHP